MGNKVNAKKNNKENKSKDNKINYLHYLLRNTRVWIDPETDIFYLSLKKGPSFDSQEINNNIIIEFDNENKIIGLEIRNLSKIDFNKIIEYTKKVLTD
ncbi:MAG: DUF2283 domain-containing protein [bacterium]|nr:DUF2283 domain-containing protein [bacterium]